MIIVQQDPLASWWKGDWLRLVVVLFATIYFASYAYHYDDWHLIDSVNLLVHEAGHLVFVPFDDLLHILGGSIFQVLFPCVYVGYFYVHREFFSASLLIFWVGQNLINVSVYAADAIAMDLPLLGGDTLAHDWHNALAMTNLLRYTDPISTGLYDLGVFVICVAVCASIITSQMHIPLARKSREIQLQNL